MYSNSRWAFRILFALIIWSMTLQVFSQTTNGPIVLSLQKAISIALEQNRDIKLSDQDRVKAEAQVKEAWAGALPQISLSGQYMRFINKPVLFIPANTPMLNPTNSTMSLTIGSDNTYSYGVSLYQPLYSRSVGIALDIAKQYGEMSEEGYQATVQGVTLQVKEAYYGVLLLQKLVEVNRQAYDVVKANADNVAAFYKNGTAAEYDLLRAQVQLANTEPLVITAENNLTLAKNALKNILSIPLDKEISVEGEFTFDEIPASVMTQQRGEAFATNPQLLQLGLLESLYDKSITVARANYFPTLGLIGAYQRQTQDNSFTFSNYNWASTLSVGLSLSMTLFDGFRTNARVEQAQVDRDKAKLTFKKAEEGLSIQIQSAELKMEEAKKRIHAQEKSLDEAKKALSIAQTRFKNGVGTQLELLDTQVAMTRTQTNYASAIYDFLIAKSEWEFAVGRIQ